MFDLHRSTRLAIRRIGLTLATIGLVSWVVVPVHSRIGPQSSSSLRQGVLTLKDRIKYQRAIEEVYWRHRIWPKENPRPKPFLDQVMPPSAIRIKVQDYLLKSQALEVSGHRPITGAQLQAEMERMARRTKQPEVLRELWTALGNDPYVIAECLARPSLANRLTAAEEPATRGNFRTLKWTKGNNRGLRNAALSGPATLLPDDPAIPDARLGHTAVWTGSEMIVFGGNGFLSTGWRYVPATDTWTATATTDAPDPRFWHTAVWTGTEMIVWGGFRAPNDFNTGGRYDPATDTWTATSTANAPSKRAFQKAVWTGSEMIVWGGYDDVAGVSLNTGGRYNSASDTWTTTSLANAPSARTFHTAVWTGSEMIVWGGFDLCLVVAYNTGGRYDPATDTWTATSTIDAPSPRDTHTAVWTGSEMIVWGGYDNTGGRYDPASDTWTATDVAKAPSSRDTHTAIWTGSEMIVWGGEYYDGTYHFLNTGGRYDPATDTWSLTDTTDAPSERYLHTAVWTGSEMIIWGGAASTTGGIAFNTGGRYDPVTDSWTSTAATNAALRAKEARGSSWLSVLRR